MGAIIAIAAMRVEKGCYAARRRFAARVPMAHASTMSPSMPHSRLAG
jgi:hypothetical protein